VIQGALTIKGEKPGLAQVSGRSLSPDERAAGRFRSHRRAAVEVDRRQVSADYANGLLLVTLAEG